MQLVYRYRAFLLTIALALAGQWRLVIGQGVIGGDPDRAYLPIKSELKRALAQARLPHWSPNFGLGVPLLAESQVAALYPPNWLLYACFDVPTAYHLNQLLHYLLMAAGVYAYVRTLGGTEWGAALAAVCFGHCGFLAIHASHEPFTLALAWMPWALVATEHVVRTSSRFWMLVLAAILAVQLLVGHFQMQFFTILLVLLVGASRLWDKSTSMGGDTSASGALTNAFTEQSGSKWRRLGLVVAAVMLAAGLAAPQLLPSLELGKQVRWTERSPIALTDYMYPVAHLPELIFATLFQLPDGPEAPYWQLRRTTEYEAHFYVGLVPLILASASCSWRVMVRRPELRIWLVIAIVSLLLSFGTTVWGPSFQLLTRVPGFGYFRAPARYTVLTSYAIAILSALSMTHRTSARPAGVVIGVLGLLVAGSLGLKWHDGWFKADLDQPERVIRLLVSSPVLVLALTGLWYWRRAAWIEPALVLLTGIEMAIFFNLAPQMRGRPWDIPAASPVLGYLADHKSLGRIAGLGNNQNLPVRFDAMTTEEYLGVSMTGLIKERQAIRLSLERKPQLIERMGELLDVLAVEYLVWDQNLNPPGYQRVWEGTDPVLDRLLRQTNPRSAPPAAGVWRIYRRLARAQWARVISDARETSTDEPSLARVSGEPISNTALLSPAEDGPFDTAVEEPGEVKDLQVGPSRVTATVAHQGSAFLLFSQQLYPGWRARVNGTPSPIYQAYGCLQLVPLPDDGPSVVELEFQPVMFRRGLVICGATIGIILWLLGSRR